MARAVPIGGTGRTSARGGPSRYRGVVWHKSNSKWEARIYEGGKQKFLGYFTNEDAAALAYDDYAIRVHGNVSKLNFPERYADVALPQPVRSIGSEKPKGAPGTVAGSARPNTLHRGAPKVPNLSHGVGMGSSSARHGGMRVQPVKGSSRFRGVSWNSNCSKWRAQVWKGSEVHHLGYFEREEDAARAYDEAALRIRGPDAPTNYPRSHYGVVSDDEEEGTMDRYHLSRTRTHSGDEGGSRMLGVSWDSTQAGWVSEIWDGKKYRLLGVFESEGDAAKAYDVACLEQHGVDALTNYPLDSYEAELAALALKDLSTDPGGLDAWLPVTEGGAGTRTTTTSGMDGLSYPAEKTEPLNRDGETAHGDGTAAVDHPGIPQYDGGYGALTAQAQEDLSCPEAIGGRTTSGGMNGEVAKPQSRFMGVGWDHRLSRWYAHIQQEHEEPRFLGYYEDEAAAARAFDAAAYERQGAMAVNFPLIGGPSLDDDKHPASVPTPEEEEDVPRCPGSKASSGSEACSTSLDGQAAAAAAQAQLQGASPFGTGVVDSAALGATSRDHSVLHGGGQGGLSGGQGEGDGLSGGVISPSEAMRRLAGRLQDVLVQRAQYQQLHLYQEPQSGAAVYQPQQQLDGASSPSTHALAMLFKALQARHMAEQEERRRQLQLQIHQAAIAAAAWERRVALSKANNAPQTSAMPTAVSSPVWALQHVKSGVPGEEEMLRNGLKRPFVDFVKTDAKNYQAALAEWMAKKARMAL